MYQVSASGDRGARGGGPELKTYENMAVDNQGRGACDTRHPDAYPARVDPPSSIAPLLLPVGIRRPLMLCRSTACLRGRHSP